MSGILITRFQNVWRESNGTPERGFSMQQSLELPHSHPSRAPAIAVTSLLWIGLCAGLVALVAMPAAVAANALAVWIALLTLFVAAIVGTFSLRYMRSDRRGFRYFASIGALVGAVLAVLFTDSLPVLALAWCFSGWLLANLIGHSGNWPEARAAARRARLAFVAGDAALLAALAVLGWQAGSASITVALAGAGSLPAIPATLAALLLLVAAAVRCALPPFSGWLLSSMTAPTPVSALMHAGLVNAGGFLLLRFAPVLEAAPLARSAAVAIGLCGAIYGIGIMLVRPDVKRSLAGSTVSQMGFMIMSCGLGAYAAALWHIVAHGLFKAWLFLGSGSAIGMRPERPVAILTGRASLGIALATVLAALIVTSSHDPAASLVPLLLALATAAATLVALLGGRAPVRAKAPVLLAIAVLVALHGAGLALAGKAVGHDASADIPGWAMLALLVVFLAAWVWQQHRTSTGRSLPLRLYVHLINAGRLPAAPQGEPK
jgi:NADH:ubiquinone oxidoreductase subunit 5 (subunit L)/multisubunit Na+/H+ antiporter MnhA subunit